MVAATLSLTIVAAVFMTNPWLGTRLGDRAEPTVQRRHLATEIDVWVTELGEAGVAVLSPVWGQAGADREHDRLLGARLGLPAVGEPLAFLRLVVLNGAPESLHIGLGDGDLRVEGPEGGAARLRSLPALLEAGGREPSPAMQAVLGTRGTLLGSVEVPAGRMADLLVAFAGPARLEDATAVTGWDGRAFRRRRMERKDWEALIETPDPERIRQL